MVACCPSLKEDTLLKALQGCPDRQGLTIVDTAWISSCAEKKARVPFDDYLIHGKRPRAGDTATHNVPAACEPGRASLLDTRFCRGNHYLNLLPGEVRTCRHVSFEELLPEDCDCALFTSLFPDRAYEWYSCLVSVFFPRKHRGFEALWFVSEKNSKQHDHHPSSRGFEALSSVKPWFRGRRLDGSQSFETTVV